MTEVNESVPKPGMDEHQTIDYEKILHEGQGQEARARPVEELRAEVLSAYGEFAPLIQDLRQGLTLYADRAEHPDYLGSGMSSDVFAILRGEERFVARIPREGKVNADNMNDYLDGALRAKGIPHLDQVVAASYEDGVTISERMPGHDMRSIRAEDLHYVTDDQLGELVDAMVAANRAGVALDPRPANFFYDREHGFGVVDLTSADKKEITKQTRVGVVAWLPMVISNAGIAGFTPQTPDDFRYLRKQNAAQIPLLERFKVVCASRFVGEELDMIEEEVDKTLAFVRADIANYDDPDWVARQVEANRVEKEQWAQAKADWDQRDPDKPIRHDLDVLEL